MSSESQDNQRLSLLLREVGTKSLLRPLATGEVCLFAPDVPPSAAAFCLAAWSLHEASPGTLIIEAPGIRQQEELANDLAAWDVPVLVYPEADTLADEESLPDPDTQSERLSVLSRLAERQPSWIVATTVALDQPVPDALSLRQARVEIGKGTSLALESLQRQLVAAGYVREAFVAQRGQFSVRGGLLDCFSWQADLPVRIEWFGDEIDSIREFDPVEQRSVRTLETAALLLLPEAGLEAKGKKDSLASLLPEGGRRVSVGDETGTAHAGAFFAHGFLHGHVSDPVLQENRRELLKEHILGWLEEGWQVWVSCNNEGEQQRLTEWFRELKVPVGEEEGGVRLAQSRLLRGFAWPAGKFALLTDAEIFGRYQTLSSLRKRERLVAMRRQSQGINYSDLAEGDYVVHLEHGVGIYCGLQEVPDNAGGEIASVLVVAFEGGSRLYVPLDQAYLISKYVGVGKKHPPLDALGGSRWEKAKAHAKKAVFDYAAHLLKVQAERSTRGGHAFPADNAWQHEFEDSFLYDETVDQLRAIEDAKHDMEAPTPMDRLVCGDVGFGKTEVAIRAAFKAVMGGKQVAFLVPTTVLARQHGQTLSERMADYPIRVGVLSRFQTKAQQHEVVRGVAAGEIDIVVGTHRLISKDVSFKNLGLAIVDEEQRFGVKQKEKLKSAYPLVDVLTLSATPIPRTLYMALVGARDMSTIDTPPPSRIAVETNVTGYDERLIRSAIERELRRGGQVYYVHNRVQTIDSVAQMIKKLVPEARIGIGHGQMEQGELEDVMKRFIDAETDVLVATTIIESGIDIPNANTIIIDRADRFGLADLYQLRGRVGRAQSRAYAMLLLPRDMLKGDAGKRVRAIQQYTQLGSGYKIAMRDLEIRGAGNILGTAQSGHITAVGFDLYCRLLKRAVAVLKGEEAPELPEITLSIDFLCLRPEDANEGREAAYVPASYMGETRWRIGAYRDLAELQTIAQWEELRKRWKDVHGKWPEPVELLLVYHKVRLVAQECSGITRVETKEGKLILTRNGDFVMVGGKFPRLTREKAKSKLSEVEKWLRSLSTASTEAKAIA